MISLFCSCGGQYQPKNEKTSEMVFYLVFNAECDQCGHSERFFLIPERFGEKIEPMFRFILRRERQEV